jgi:SAM-dependent methyltransferase
MSPEPGGPEFDSLAAGYEDALDDPWRRRFSGDSDFFIEQKCRALVREVERRGGNDGVTCRTLDVGCGKGPAVRFLRDRWTTFGTDVSREMLREARATLPLVVQEPLRLPFASGVFDIVFAFCVYHHVARAQHVSHLRELVRVARPGGLVFVFEHNPYNPVTRLVFSRASIDQGCTMIRPRNLRRTFRDAGLGDIGTGYVLFFPQRIARHTGGIEDAMRHVPFGGQYYVVGRKDLLRG